MWQNNEEIFSKNFKIKTVYAYFVRTVLRREDVFKKLIADNALVIRRIIKRKYNSDNIHHKQSLDSCEQPICSMALDEKGELQIINCN